MKTLKNNCKVLIPFLVLCLGFISSGIQSQNLDNKTFEITMNDVNKPNETTIDILTFKNGKFNSMECLVYGHFPTDYTSRIDGEKILFSATTDSEEEGEMMWEGIVKGITIEGIAIWKKEGQKDITYNYRGKIKKKSIQ